MPSKTPTICNWVPSTITEDRLKEFFLIGFLPSKSVMSYRAPDPEEERPNPKDGEVIVFTDHMNRGFSPPGSKFFREVLHFFKLHPQDIGPNSISNICNFQVLCEVYLQQEPTVELFREYFYLNRQNECTNGLSLELGGISIQRRQGAVFPLIVLPSHPKDWNQTWFYCQDISPANEKPLPGYRPDRLDSKFALPDKLTVAERKKLLPSIRRINGLLGNGLTGVDLTRCWISWRIIPLSRRSKLMYEYGGDPDDSLRHTPVQLTEEDIVAMSNLLVNAKYEDCSVVGLNPFCKLNPVPEVRIF